MPSTRPAAPPVLPPPPVRTPVWTHEELLLWETARVVGAIIRSEPVHGHPAPFAMHLAGDGSEGLLVASGFQRRWLGIAGDGTYRTSTTFVGGFSPLGVVLGAATLGASAVGNARRRAKAARAATECWRPLDQGVVHVSTHGFYLDVAGRLFGFRWGCVQRMTLLAPGVVQFTAEMATGSVETYEVTSGAAEAMFAFWCLAACRSHPQFVGLVWLPEGFVSRVRTSGLLEQLGGGSLPQVQRLGAGGVR